MSKSSAPTAATPSIPSVARAGCRARLRHANASAFIGGRVFRPLRRSSAHEAITVATVPSGTAIARQSAATSGVMRTNTRAVLYRHWKNLLIRLSDPTASPRPRSAPTPAISSPSIRIWVRMRRTGKPMSRRTPTVSRRSSTSMMLRPAEIPWRPGW